MKAFILAAGLGTRLKEYTADKPKALVEVGGKTQLEIVIGQLKRAGITEVVINLHHYAQQIIAYVEANKHFGIQIQFSDETDLLLDTGGALKHARKFFDNTNAVLVHNVDILCNVNLQQMYEFHLKNNALATLAVKNRNTSRSLLINQTGQLAAWRNEQTGATKPKGVSDEGLLPVAFSGIHIYNPKLTDLMTENGVFSIIDVYLRLCQSEKISTFSHNESYWIDMGNASHFAEAEQIIKTTIE